MSRYSAISWFERTSSDTGRSAPTEQRRLSVDRRRPPASPPHRGQDAARMIDPTPPSPSDGPVS